MRNMTILQVQQFMTPAEMVINQYTCHTNMYHLGKKELSHRTNFTIGQDQCDVKDRSVPIVDEIPVPSVTDVMAEPEATYSLLTNASGTETKHVEVILWISDLKETKDFSKKKYLK